MGVESFGKGFAGAIFIVVAFDAGDVEGAHEVEAFFGIGAIANDVAQGGDLSDRLGFYVIQNGLKSLEVAVEVGDDGVFHALVIPCAKDGGVKIFGRGGGDFGVGMPGWFWNVGEVG